MPITDNGISVTGINTPVTDNIIGNGRYDNACYLFGIKNKKNQNFLYSFITSIHSYIHTHPLHYIHTQLQPYTSLYIHSSIHKELVTLRYAGRLKSMLAKIQLSLLVLIIKNHYYNQLLINFSTPLSIYTKCHHSHSKNHET